MYVDVCIPAELWRFWIHTTRASRRWWHHRAVSWASPLPATLWAGWEQHNIHLSHIMNQPRNCTELKFHPDLTAHFKQINFITGRGFNNLSLVNMARHIPTGQLVAVKQTNLDECTEEELLQLMVSCSPAMNIYYNFWGCTSFSFRCVDVWLCFNPQNEVLLSRLFRHPNLLTSRLVFSSCCQLWILTPLMAYGQFSPAVRILSSFLT